MSTIVRVFVCVKTVLYQLKIIIIRKMLKIKYRSEKCVYSQSDPGLTYIRFKEIQDLTCMSLCRWMNEEFSVIVSQRFQEVADFSFTAMARVINYFELIVQPLVDKSTHI